MDTLPHDVRHMFDVRRIGKTNAAICRRCSYRSNFEKLPLTAHVHGKLARHVAYHEKVDGYLNGVMQRRPLGPCHSVEP